ncbi:MAG: hypothetical protein JSR41_21775 [Proteobacteria bacterium]|nr:hypothetical protein [Pseudomonadota bacterium]
MRLLLLDPGLSSPYGHNASTVRELDLHVREHGGIELSVATHAGFDPASLGATGCRWRPHLRLHGYARFGTAGAPRAAAEAEWRECLALCVQDLDRMDLASFDGVWMPTAYPLHLAALAHVGLGMPALRVQVGVLMPPRFWAADASARVWLEELTCQSLRTAAGLARWRIYSETDRVRAGGLCLATPTLLAPLADAFRTRLDALRTSRAAAPASGIRTRFGFMGEPLARKGFTVVSQAVATGLPPHIELHLAMPTHHAARALVLHGRPPGLHIHALGTGNAAYFDALNDIDVLLALYDPGLHDEQMSGIVGEAIALGKAVLVGAGCEAILAFLRRWAPGSFRVAPASLEGLHAAWQLPPSVWASCRREAMAAAPRVLALKDVARHLRFMRQAADPQDAGRA